MWGLQLYVPSGWDIKGDEWQYSFLWQPFRKTLPTSERGYLALSTNRVQISFQEHPTIVVETSSFKCESRPIPE